MRVLVVDEDPVVVGAVVAELQAAGAEVVGMAEVGALRSLLHTEHFHVLIGGHLAVAMARPGCRRWLLTSTRGEWTAAQLESLGVELVLDTPWNGERRVRNLLLILQSL